MDPFRLGLLLEFAAAAVGLAFVFLLFVPRWFGIDWLCIYGDPSSAAKRYFFGFVLVFLVSWVVVVPLTILRAPTLGKRAAAIPVLWLLALTAAASAVGAAVGEQPCS